MEYQTLSGRFFMHTRPRGQGGELSDFLIKKGARILEFPTVEIYETEDVTQLELAFKGLEKGSWLLFTSSNSIKALLSCVSGVPLKDLVGSPTPVLVDLLHSLVKHFRIGAIGHGTAKAIRSFGLEVDFVSQTQHGEGFGEQFLAHYGETLRRKKTPILIPRGSIYQPSLLIRLQNFGLNVKDIEVYTTRPFNPGSESIRKLRLALSSEKNDLSLSGILATSSYALKELASLVSHLGPDSGQPLIDKLKNVPCFSIGGKTEEKALEIGFNKVLVSRTTSFKGLVSFVENYFFKLSDNTLFSSVSN